MVLETSWHNPHGESGAWVELKYQSCMKINGIVLFQPIKTFRLIKRVRDFQISSSKF